MGDELKACPFCGGEAAVANDPQGSHDLISHDGPRSERGGRLSYVAGRVAIAELEHVSYGPGDTYFMPELAYHDTPNSGIVVTIMRKLTEGTIHASSLIEHGHTFDQSFDRYQLNDKQLWAFVEDAVRSVR
jgi:hypothetical protein